MNTISPTLSTFAGSTLTSKQGYMQPDYKNTVLRLGDTEVPPSNTS